jgi:2-polyprenyl-3-methyl-5-hydroxy-6-metoxy-1,4-benzoquinol methylase
MYELSSEQDPQIDWGKTSTDYAKHRPGPPPSFYHRLKALNVGLPSQRIMDLGTGTGVIARQLAKQGCHVMASDISAEQIRMAAALAKSDKVRVDFQVASAEATHAPDHSLDVVTANQCFL